MARTPRTRKPRHFSLAPAFVEGFQGRQPEWGYGGLGYFTYKRTYSRATCDCDDPNTCTHPTEEWWQTCQRVVEGTYNIQKRHCSDHGLPWSEPKAQVSAQDMFQRMWDFKFLPPGRGLWMMGTRFVSLKGSAALNNCAFVSTEGIAKDFASPFCFLMDMSMLGVGVGGDARGAGKVQIRMPQFTARPFVVKDSREGWVDLIRVVLRSMVGKGALPMTIDFSRVRDRGVAIKTFGGTASGPKALRGLVDSLTHLLMDPLGRPFTWDDTGTDDRGGVMTLLFEPVDVAVTSYKITSTQLVDIFNYIGKAVVAGGVRRSSEIMFGDAEDQEFLALKQDMTALVDRRWASNNSIFGKVGMDYGQIAAMIAKNGEPGIAWLDNMQRFSRMGDPPDGKDYRVMGANPCVEQSLESFELCCLVETFPAHHDSLEDYQATLKKAYLYAKTVTLVPTHEPRSNAVMMRNRRIGTSMSGVIQAINKVGRRDFLSWCDQGYGYLKSLDRIYSDWLCVPLSIKITSNKPSGTVSLLAGATPGIHYPHSQYYVRNVRVQGTSPLIEMCRAAGYQVEPDTYAPDTFVVSFPVEEKHFVKCKDDVTIWEQFANAAALQRYWADNQVSATITFRTSPAQLVQDEGGNTAWRDLPILPTDVPVLDAREQPIVRPSEVDQIKPCLENYETQLKAISLLPLTGHGYVQAPYITITESEYTLRAAMLKELDLSGSEHEVTESFCTNDTCEMKPRP